MPVTYSFLENAVWFKLSGDVLPAQFSEEIDKAVADEHFRLQMFIFFDLGDYTRSPTAEELRERVRFLKALGEKISLTVVMLVSSDFRYGLARMFENYAELNSVEVEIFREEAQAIKWLKEHKKNFAMMNQLDAGLCFKA